VTDTALDPYDQIPERLRYGLVHYFVWGFPPGSFLCSVLENDLMGALSTGSEESLQALRGIGVWLYQFAPRDGYGSPTNVNAWADARRQGEPSELSRYSTFKRGLAVFARLGDKVATEALSEIG